MAIYYSPSRNAFFDSAIFGERTVKIVDEAKQDAALKRANQRDEQVYRTAVTSRSEEEPQPLRALFNHHVKKATARPILVTVTNPDCTMPSDAEPITHDEWQALLEAQSAGQEIRRSANDLPVTGTPKMEKAAKIEVARARRNRALAASDWTQLADAPLTVEQKKEWNAYRQRLRDLPEKLWRAKPDALATMIENALAAPN